MKESWNPNRLVFFQLSAKFEQLFQSISQIEADFSLLDMHSLTDMVDHIQLIIKTLQVFEKEVDQMKKEIAALDGDETVLRDNVLVIEDKLAQLTTRSEKALKIVEVRNCSILFIFIVVTLFLFPQLGCH